MHVQPIGASGQIRTGGHCLNAVGLCISRPAGSPVNRPDGCAESDGACFIRTGCSCVSCSFSATYAQPDRGLRPSRTDPGPFGRTARRIRTGGLCCSLEHRVLCTLAQPDRALHRVGRAPNSDGSPGQSGRATFLGPILATGKAKVEQLLGPIRTAA